MTTNLLEKVKWHLFKMSGEAKITINSQIVEKLPLKP